jgi:ribosomal protein S18 acetylase RimI-like enzyme
MRKLNFYTLPVIYQEQFYQKLISFERYSKYAYYKDVLIGAISCKEDIVDGEVWVYIMTITVLEPYRRFQIGSQLLEQALKDCVDSKRVRKVYLHVQSSNESALEFYKNNGFYVDEFLEDYYTDIKPSDCYLLKKDILK